MGQFYTNTDKLISEIMTNILPSSDNLYFLVGFFYFSGFKELYKSLDDKNIKVLIGMNVELGIKNTVKEVYNIGIDKDRDYTTDTFLEQVKAVINKTEILDNKEGLEALKIFVRKIGDGSLVIRKTLSPNHSKLYLFQKLEKENQKGEFPGEMVTGSSNFTYSGLSGRHEMNVLFRDKESYNKGKDVFDELWRESILITEGKEEKVKQALESETWLNIPSPYHCYIRLLYEYLDLNIDEGLKMPSEITGNSSQTFHDLKYQIDAINKGKKIIDKHNGVIIADVVGLGKSIIGSTLLHNMNEKAIVIAPPHLIDSWNDYKEKFDFHAEVFSSGKIQKALDHDTEYNNVGIILIDEVHKYRNDDTLDYSMIHELCQGKKVILLTATPFNNKPDDIFNLVKLFQVPGKSTLNTTHNLQVSFAKLQSKYDKIRKKQREKLDQEIIRKDSDRLSKEIKNLIGPLMVRRSRIDLDNMPEYKKDLKDQGYEFSNVQDPETKKFVLGNLEKLYEDTLSKLIEKIDQDGKEKPKYFHGARYKVLGYIKDRTSYEKKIESTLGYKYELLEGRQANMPWFIRRLLVSRFESSIYAFKKTLESLIDGIQNIQNYLEKHNAVPVIKKGSLPKEEDFEENLEYIKEDNEQTNALQEYINDKDGFLVGIDDLKDDFVRDMNQDKQFLQSLLDEWNQVDRDPKGDEFVELIQKQIKNDHKRKIVIFSQYKDTVDYMYKKLKDSGIRVLGVTGSNKTQIVKEHIKYNFDAGVEPKKQLNEYDVLIATDSISEGYNLHRAGTIFNYDIPYNPTIIIQRVGRINRINKKVFENLYIFNYFPSELGENITNKKKIAKLKINMINAILGNDTKIIDETDRLKTFNNIDDVMGEEIQKDDENQGSISWDVEYRNFLKDELKNDASLEKNIMKIPSRTKIRRLSDKHSNLIITFVKKGGNSFFRLYDTRAKETKEWLDHEAFEMFKASKDEKGLEVSEEFFKYYKVLKERLSYKQQYVKANLQTQKAIKNLELLIHLTSDQYFKEIIELIKIGAIPKYKMRFLRRLDIKPNTFGDIAEQIKGEFSQKLIDDIKARSEEITEQEEIIMITEEFEGQNVIDK